MARHAPSTIDRARHAALMNGKYHADREAFLDFWDKLITFAVLAAGGTAFLDVFGQANQKLGAATLTIFALVQLVYSLPVKARKHANLRERYFDIAARLANGSLAALQAESEMLLFAGQEDPPYCAAHALSENWATTAVFGPIKTLPCEIGFLRKSLRHWLRQEAHNFSAP